MSDINKIKLLSLKSFKEVNGNLIFLEFKKKLFYQKEFFRFMLDLEKLEESMHIKKVNNY